MREVSQVFTRSAALVDTNRDRALAMVDGPRKGGADIVVIGHVTGLAPPPGPGLSPPLTATAGTLAVQMGVLKAPAIAAALIGGGAPAAIPVSLVERAGGRGARRLRRTLATRPEAIRAAGRSSPAIILIDPARATARAQDAPTTALAA